MGIMHENDFTDMMQYQALTAKYECPLNIPDEVKDILIDRAPILFQNYSNHNTILEAMKDLVAIVHNYYHRKSKIDKQVYDVLTVNQPRPLQNKSQDEKIISFQKHANMLIDLMGGMDYHASKESIQLKELLSIASKSPEEYLRREPNFKTASKEDIREYLIDLKSARDTQSITDFIKALK